MMNAPSDNNMTENLKMSLFHQTETRRMVDLSENVTEKLHDLFKKCSYFSLCVDDSTDQIHVKSTSYFHLYSPK